MAGYGSSLKSAALLEQMKSHLTTDAEKELIKKTGLVYQVNFAPRQKIGVDEEIYVIDLKVGKVTQGAYKGKPDASFSLKYDDFLAIATEKMNPQIAFIRGSMKIKGSLSAAQKFTPDIFQNRRSFDPTHIHVRIFCPCKEMCFTTYLLLE
ncbi:hypothetical protein KSP40_PGU014265 [Platanthera guangdongensis]|uniref:SCP2 domain-containing protein n=1 Tax=Platanthera guangdongensis TaxID=2320717 RepID=A0ABR2LQS6_9ASPA